ncbi:hypothetical protein AMES_5515 [Amycolatopsis mediterranei S699]|uniref:Uncharacterized protein n=2 Tax=Amycolatopsis mediterranei TaxID=33910 RepID=A0A0H3D8N2_AMYMU|nr:DUF5994 family protein [Amycolatopsis mediterranei]ADJ47340.1 conserved hypothetical protein [Amycolatopsis mediterranei U32]AEK44175.1 hypothetical protein RAM_28490 [Amycolatopsis mediterranei S699]AFO79051.1 hypothetical protein AMES_5515 [Amycolatopsis mediterranei S699]AGT86179.1 hypothetical protein B737_5515 [Amycolatopsis mediterranei RB]KDO12474.1 hypothetical protein DV26_02145 [Amycolatopsis mediterranei]
MSSGPNTLAAQPVTEPRLRLKPAGPATGHVDGAWWPRTRELTAELPALLAVLAARLGRVDRVTYHLGDWPDPPRRVTCDGSGVRLEGFRSQPSGSLTVIGWGRHRTTLLVVPPETSPDAAQQALTAAADPENTGHSTDLPAANGQTPTGSGAPLPS